MINAKEELLEHVGERRVTLVRTVYKNCYKNIQKSAEGTLEEVLPELDFTYNEDCGRRQELFGFIWYEDGSWSERVWSEHVEYYACEWWKHKVRPAFDISILA